MSPSPAQRHEFSLDRLRSLLERVAGDRYFFNPDVGVILENSYRIPDLTAIPLERVALAANNVAPADVDLVVEVVSPTSRSHDRILKPAQYAAAGIGSYWPLVPLTGQGCRR